VLCVCVRVFVGVVVVAGGVVVVVVVFDVVVVAVSVALAPFLFFLQLGKVLGVITRTLLLGAVLLSNSST